MKKGVSITSLAMYIVVLTMVIGIIVAFNVNILDDSDRFVKASKLYEQYTKFNMFFLEVLGESPTVRVIDDNTIAIHSGADIGMFEYSSANREITYAKGTDIIVVAQHVEDIIYDEVDNTLKVSMTFKLGDSIYQPQDVYYAIGGWYNE